MVSTPKFLHGRHHAAGFQLEHGDRHAPAEQFVGRPVVERDQPDVEVRRVPADQPHRIVDDGERLQPEEVHLEHAQLGQRTHGVLGDDFVLIAAGQRDVDVEIVRADDDARGVHAGAAGQAFEFGRRTPRARRWRVHSRSRRPAPDFSARASLRVMFSSFGIILAMRSASP